MSQRKQIAFFVLLIALAVAVLGSGLGKQPLMDVDEATYAEIARQMLQRDDWVIPQYRDYPSFLKPPLFYWSVAVSYEVFGVNEFAVRFVSLLYALATCGLTYGIARRFGGPRVATLAALIWIAHPAVFVLVRNSVTDMTLTCMIALSIYGFVRGYDDPEKKPDAISFYALWGGAALGTLTKGPIGIGIPFTVILFYLWATGRWRRFFRLSWLAGIPLWAVVVLPWYVLSYFRLEQWRPGGGREFLEKNLIFHNVKKFFESGHYTDHQGIEFLFTNFLWLFFPWVLVFLVGFARKMYVRFRRKEPLSAAEAFGYIWLFYPMAVFSLSKFKLPSYVVPGFAGCALIAAIAVARWIDGESDRVEAATVRWAMWLAVIGAGLVAFAGLALFFPDPIPFMRLLPLILLANVLALVVRLARRPGARFHVVAIGALAILAAEAFMAGNLQPEINRYNPYRRIGTLLKAEYSHLQPLYLFRTGVTASLRFYSDMDLKYVKSYDELDSIIANRPGAMILIRDKRYAELGDARRARLQQVRSWPQYHVSKLNGTFLMEKTRPDVLRTQRLMRVTYPGEPPVYPDGYDPADRAPADPESEPGETGPAESEQGDRP